MSNKTISLRRFNLGDRDNYYDIVHRDEKIAKFFPYAYQETAQDADAFILSKMAGEIEATENTFAITDGENLVGMISALTGSYMTNCDISYFIGEKYRRKGYAKEAIDLMMKYVNQNYNVHQFTFSIDSENEASINLVRSIGAKKSRFSSITYYIDNAS